MYLLFNAAVLLHMEHATWVLSVVLLGPFAIPMIAVEIIRSVMEYRAAPIK